MCVCVCVCGRAGSGDAGGTFFSFFIQILKVTLHLQLLENMGHIPWAVQHILVACLTPNH